MLKIPKECLKCKKDQLNKLQTETKKRLNKVKFCFNSIIEFGWLVNKIRIEIEQIVTNK